MTAPTGILVPGAGRFSLSRHLPSADLTSIIDRFWIVRWDLRGEPPFEQETLPFPCANLAIGTHRPGLHGPVTGRFVARLDGEGWVVGAKFRPAGLFGMVSDKAVALVDRVLSLAEAFFEDGRVLEASVLTAGDDLGKIALLEAFVRSHHPGPDQDAQEANRIVELARTDSAISRVADLAARAEHPVRAIERMFRNKIGVSPKWVIRRFRVQEAAERLAAGGALDCPALAHELGYFDQAHFIRDFKSQVGRTPAQYAKLCAEAPR